MLKNLLNSHFRYKGCKYFARKSNTNKTNIFNKFVEEYGKTKISKEEFIENEKLLEIKKRPVEYRKQREAEELIEQGFKSGKTQSQIMSEIVNEDEPLPIYEKVDEEVNFDEFINKDNRILENLQKLKDQAKLSKELGGSPDDDLYTNEEIQDLKNILGKKNVKNREKTEKEYIDIKPQEQFNNDDDDQVDKKFEKEFLNSFNKTKTSNNTNTKTKKLKKLENLSESEADNEEDKSRLIMKSEIDNLPEEELDKALKRQNSFDAQQKFMELVQKDIDTFRFEKEKENAIAIDAKKMSRVSSQNILDVPKTKDIELKKRALRLANLWHMNLAHTKHWFYRLKREEKVIVKALLRLRKLEMKKRLKKLSKQWKIENDDILEIDYLKPDEQDKNKNLDIPKHFRTLDEFFFFGDDIEFLRHYKRTCGNILEALNKFLSSNKQTVKRGIGKNLDIYINEVKMNKSCTIVYAWWDLPMNFIEDGEQLLEEEVLKKIELNLNQSVPYIRGYLTREIRLKYAPEIRFLRDTYSRDYDEFNKYVDTLREENKSKLENVDYLLSKKEIAYFKNYSLNDENFKSLLEAMDNTKDRDELSKTLETQRIYNLYDFFKRISKNAIEFRRHMDYAKEMLKITDAELEKADEAVIKKTEKNHKSKLEKKAEREKQKVFKKLKITNENELEEKTDFNEIYINYVNSYERKIPKVTSFGLNLDQTNKEAEGKEKDEKIARNFKNSIKQAVRSSEKLVKGKKKNKAEEFWKSLDNLH